MAVGSQRPVPGRRLDAAQGCEGGDCERLCSGIEAETDGGVVGL